MEPVNHEDQALSQAIQARATRYVAPEHLELNIKRVLGAENHSLAGEKKAKWRHQLSWQSVLSLGIAFAVGVVVSVVLYPASGELSQTQRLEDEIINEHVRSLQLSHLMDVVSTNQHTVKPWFAGKIDFSPAVPDLADKGYVLAGGRLDYIGGRSVACLVYRRRQHIINVFLWPASSIPQHITERNFSKNGYHVVAWISQGMQYWTVSDLNIQELNEFIRLMKS